MEGGGKSYIKSYFEFLKNNVRLLIFVIFILTAIYGLKLFNIVISMDTDLHMEHNQWAWSIQIGRFGYAFLQKLFHPFGFNLYLSTFLALTFLAMGTMAWCHFINIVSPSEKRMPLYLFAAFFASSNVWTSQIYFSCQSAEALFIVFICPIVVYFFFVGILHKNKIHIALSMLMVVFIISVYQSSVLMICVGLLICFYYNNCRPDETNDSEKERWILALKIIVAVAICLVVYFLVDRLVCAAFGIQKGDFYHNEYLKKDTSLIKNLAKFLVKMAARNPLTAIFLVVTFPMYLFIVRQKNSVVCAITLLLIPASCCVFGIITGTVSYRVEYSTPLAMAFIIFILLKNFKESARMTAFLIGTVLGFLCVEESSMFNYTELRRHEQDKAIAQDIASRIGMLGTPEEISKLPVLLYGTYKTEFNSGHLNRGVFCHSAFHSGGGGLTDATRRGIAFMNDIGFVGYDFKKISVDDMSLVLKARAEAERMPNYPEKGCVKNIGDAIVVRLSDITDEL